MDLLRFSKVLRYFLSLYFIFLQSSCAHIASLTESLRKAPYNGAIPARSDDAMTGSQFIQRSRGLSLENREKAILREVRRGNIPNFLSNLKPVHFTLSIKGITRKATIFVMPDYLAIGSDTDYIRMPMNPITAQRVADHFGFVLPTQKMVDAIYRQAELKLAPKPLPPTKMMTTNAYYLRHNYIIKKQLTGMDQNILIAGHKKDVVLTNRLFRRPKRVAIYGWHRKSGKAIQPLSLVHGNHYADYSHGVRLVAGMMLLDEKEVPVLEVLNDSRLAYIISYEGRLKYRRVITEFVR